MCNGSSGSGGSGGSGGGYGGANLNSYVSGGISSMSKGEKLDALDKVSDKLTSQTNQLFKDTQSGKLTPGSQRAKNEVNRISSVERQVSIARDATRGYSLSALQSKYSSERKSEYKTSKEDIKRIYEKWK